MQQLISVTLATSISLIPKLAIAQNNNFQYPQPNKQGDYTSILSKLPNGQKSPHLLWQVISSQLNCRSQPGANNRVVRSLAKGNTINIVGQPKVYRDRQGKTWLYIAKEGSAADTKIRCFVRANNQFIKPIPYSY